ncbi:MAG: DUF349 domain-containing protein [Flavobacteriales bacterium]
MSFSDIRTRFEALLANDNNDEIRNSGQDLVKEFYDLLDKRAAKPEEGGDENAWMEDDKNIEVIREQVKTFRERMDLFRKDRENIERSNFETKKRILGDFMKLISQEENISKAYFKFNELKEEWRNVGAVAYDKTQELQAEYTRLNELFHYNLNIYKELRENDLKKNIDLRNEVIEKINSLAAREDLKEIDTLLRAYQREWDDTGAVPKENWEEMKEKFHNAVQAIHEKLNLHYEERKQQQVVALQAKKAQTEKIRSLGASFPTAKKWEDATKQIMALQEEWKTIGYAGRDENDNVWNEFREACDVFFTAKKAFYGGLKEKAGDINKVKEALIAKAEEWAKSSDWRKATDTFKKLQEDWKNAGGTGLRSDNALWNKFRAACDQFFNRKKEHFAANDLAQADNLKTKEAFIASLKDVELSEDGKENFNKLKDLQNKFRELGDVPFKEKDRIYAAFREAMDMLWDKAKIDKTQRDIEIFKEKINNIQGGGENAQRTLFKERDFIRGRINKITEEIGQIENNLGFFSKGKKPNPLLQEYHQKIENLKKEQDQWKAKLKMLNQVKV